MRKISALLLLATASCGVAPIQSYEQYVRDAYLPDNHQCSVTVNYNVSVDSLIKTGEHNGSYFLPNPLINSKNFSLTISGEKRIQVQIVHFDRQPLTYSEISTAFNQHHLRPINSQEFLCFIQTHNSYLKDLSIELDLLMHQRIEIICLGSSYQPKNNSYSEVLRWRMSDGMDGLEGIPVPVLDLTLLELNWLSDSYFAVVSLDSQEEDAEIKPKTLNR